MRTAMKVQTSEQLKGDWLLRFNSARGVPSSSFVSMNRKKVHCPRRGLVYVDVLMRGKNLSHVRLPAGDHHHVLNALLVEVE